MSAPASKPATSRGVLTMGIAAALLSATGQATPKTLARLVELGLPDIAARAILHAAPVILIIGAVIIGRALGRGQSKLVRGVIYALCGMVAGFFTAYCLDLLVGVPAAIEALNGPLAEPDVIEIALWTYGAIVISMGLMVAVIATFGPPGAQAINLEDDLDPEALDIRKAERASFGLSAVGLVAMGVASIALSIARQSADGAVLGPCLIAIAAGLVGVLLSFVLWSRLDELQRRQVVDAYATSAVLFTLVAFGLVVAQALDVAPPFDAGAVFVGLSITQLVATFVATASFAGKARAERRPA